MLSSIMGVDMRTTMDIDTNITGITFNQDKIEEIINSIIKIDLGDNVSLEMSKIENIKEGKEYNGFKFSIIGCFENIKVPFHIDVSTGDKVTPSSIHYQYKKMFEDQYITLMAYNYETIIAEKLQSILDLKLQNSRMKDYYDIYYFMVFKFDELDADILKLALHNTFENRNTLDDLVIIRKLLEVFKKDESLNKFWLDYQKTHSYAKNITFNEIVAAIKKILIMVG